MGNRRAFTLVELAIVLVIIGIILGAILKGQELINNAKMKRLYSQYKEVVAAVYTYYDRYGKFPGDDNLATTRGWTTENGDSDGLIDGGFEFDCDDTNDDESCVIWEHLRLAGIISGSDRSNPQHSYGGAVGVAYGTVQGDSANWIAFQNIPKDVAQSIDTQYDDGEYDTGSVRGSADYTGTGTVTLYIRL